MKSVNWRYIASILFISIVYFAAARLGLSLAFINKQVTAVWPPTGIALAAILLLGYRVWPGIALGAFCINALTGTVPTAFGLAAGNTLEALAGAFLLRRIVRFENSLQRLPDVLGLVVLAAAASTTISATLGVVSLCLGGAPWSHFVSIWLVWWLGDAMGALVIAPFLLTWATSPGLRWQGWRLVELAALFIGLILVCQAVMLQNVLASTTTYSLAFLVYPFIIWGALRFGQRETTTATLMVSAFATWGAIHNVGPFAIGGFNERLNMLQLFMAATAITALIMGAVTTEREQASSGLRKARDEMEERVRDRTAELALANRDLAEKNRGIEEINNRLIETERIKSEFFANVSHELRTPLTLLLAPVESVLAAEGGNLSSLEKQALQTVHNNAVRLLQMVNGLLDFSKFDAGRMEVNLEPIEIVSLAQSLLADFQPLMRQKGLECKYEFSGENHFVMMDRYLFERIVFNLVSNAVKFTESGGKVSVNLTLRDNQLKLSVTDTGIGISEPDRKHLFEKFRQLEGASTRRFQGTGLGLALAREFAGLLSGTIVVDSRKGEGSTFTLECPAPACAGNPSRTYSRPISLPPIQGYETGYPSGEEDRDSIPDEDAPKIVVAEDNPELALYIRSLLLGSYQIRIARDGTEALELARLWSPDLILSDVMMPNMDGLTLCREIKSSQATAMIPVVLLTALTHRDALMKGWEAGADEYLFKPFHPKELVTRIKSLVAAREEQRRVEKIRVDLVAFAAHQLKTPLSEIIGYVELMLSGLKGDVPESQKTCLLKILEISKRDLRLISNLLSVSQIEQNTVLPDIEPVELKEIVSYAVKDFREMIERKGLSLLVNEPEEKVTVSADLPKTVEAVRNVIENAIRFTDQGSITIDLKSENGFGMIEVRDTGTGIPDKVISKLFTKELIFKGPRERGGSGLGLYISKSLMKLQSGEVAVAAGTEKGSRFIFKLPLYNPKRVDDSA